eukprot:gene2647-13283_t
MADADARAAAASDAAAYPRIVADTAADVQHVGGRDDGGEGAQPGAAAS